MIKNTNKKHFNEDEKPKNKKDCTFMTKKEDTNLFSVALPTT